VKPAAPDLAAMNAATAWAWLAGELTAAVGSARHGLHLLTVANVGTDGQPDARTVVLRHVDPLRREVRFHSDIRSPKLQALRTSPQVALHWYDPALRVQVRIDLHHRRRSWRCSRRVSGRAGRSCRRRRHGPRPIRRGRMPV
jgi:pyridoxine/pyridoxamine 5'-phosphate oxidase